MNEEQATKLILAVRDLAAGIHSLGWDVLYAGILAGILACPSSIRVRRK